MWFWKPLGWFQIFLQVEHKKKLKQFVHTNFKWIMGEISMQIKRTRNSVTRAVSTRSSKNNWNANSEDLYIGDINLKLDKESIQSRPIDDILLNKDHLVKAMVFPVVMYGCESFHEGGYGCALQLLNFSRVVLCPIGFLQRRQELLCPLHQVGDKHSC